MTGREEVRGMKEGSWAYQRGCHSGPHAGAWGRPARKVSDVTQGGTLSKQKRMVREGSLGMEAWGSS